MSRKKLMEYISSILIIILWIAGPAYGTLIDFEGLGLNDGDSLPSIGIVSFDGSAVVQGGGAYGFISSAGNDTGNSGSFNMEGNTFITNQGGVWSNESIKELNIEFSSSITNLQFDIADIDSALPQTIERLTASVYDFSNTSIGSILYQAPTSGNLGNGDVVKFDFEMLSGIRTLTIQLDNIGTIPSATAYGFGLDNLQFYASPVPEPSTMFLFGILIAGLAGTGFKWNSQK